jgi:hypothetical protein
MANSALELYQKAYDLHYKRNDIAHACEIYTKIIDDFGTTDAAAYAAIQLQKIKANEATLEVARTGKRRAGPVATTFIVINLILLLGAAAASTYLHYRTDARLEKMSLLSRVLGKMYAGRDNEALQLLDEMKIRMRKDITPFALAADIHRKNHEYLKARKQYEAFQRLYPGSPIPREEIARINEEEDVYIERSSDRKKTDALPQEIVEEAAKKNPARSKRRPVRRRTQPSGEKPKLLVDPDEIEFF